MDGEVGDIKKKLKQWEYFFTKCHQRKPARADIDAAPEDIKASYKLYGKLKNKLTSPPSTDERSNIKENVDNVWGSHVSLKSLEKHQVRIEFTADGEMKTVNVIDEDDNKPTVKWSDKFTKNLLNHNKTPNKARNNTRNPGLSRSANITTNQLNGGTNHNDEAVLNIPTVATPRIIKPKTRAIPRGWKSMVDNESESSELPPFVKTLKSSSDTTSSPADTGQCSRHPLGDHKSTPNSPGVESTLTKTPAKLRTPVITFQTHQSPSSVSDSQHLQSDKTPIKVGAFHTGIVTKSEIPTLTNQQVDSGAATPQRPKPTFNVSVFKKPASELVPQRPSSPEEVQKITRTVTRVRKPRATVSRAKTDKKESGSAKKAKKTEEQPESQNSSANTLAQQSSTNERVPSEVDPYAFDEAGSTEPPQSQNRKRVSRVKTSKIEAEADGANTEADQNDSGAAIKAKTVKPRKRKAVDTDNDEDDALEKSTQKMASKKTKLSSGTVVNNIRPSMTRNVNDNYVKLNLRKKTYARGKGGLKGAAYKRHQWKSKMSAKRGTACFKCGEEGHWANKCTKSGPAKSDKEPEVEFNEDTDGFLVDKPPEEYLDDLMLGAYTGEKEEQTQTYSNQACEPLFDHSVTQSDRQNELLSTLKQVFKFKSFRPGQLETVERIAQGKSTLVMLSTGAGKSLCYQLPAYMYSQRGDSIAIIISPLVSLMEDQVSDLPKGVIGVCLHTNQTETMRTKCMNAVLEGGVQFLLCSPEFMCSTSHANIEFFNKIPPISFACIDEAHCLSEWSHNFRPSYLRVCKILRVRFGVTCFLGLTATATKETVLNIAKHLNLTDCEEDCVKGTILPPNLNLSVSKDCFKEQALLELLQSKRFKDCKSIIIYCTRREQTDRLATVIRTVLSNGGEKSTDKIAESYHAGLSAAQRRRIQKQFMSGKLRIVVATVAFGMGLDKSDVRAVIHFTLPKGFESYVQEIGRAGRDGLPAECHVFLEPEASDVSELEKHFYADSVDQSSIRKLLSMMYKPCKCQMLADTVNEGECDMSQQVCPGHERAIHVQKAIEKLNISEQGIATLIFYLELHNTEWLENMSSVYSKCTVKCYGGPIELHNAARKCIPLGVAMAMKKKNSNKIDGRDLNFNIMDVSSLLNKPSGFVKKDLKSLQFTQNADGKWKRTGIVIEFSELAMRVRAPGNLSDDQLDEILQFLKQRVAAQENKEVTRLHYFYHVLNKLAFKDYFMVSEEADKSRSDSLKQSIVEYFQSANPTENYVVPDKTGPSNDVGFIGSQVASFIGMYSHEHDFTGRDVAKILYGIPSPNYPPNVWGRVRRFWRSLLGCDFNTIVRIATEQLIKVR